MRSLSIICYITFTFCAIIVKAQKKELIKLWETNTILNVPRGLVLDKECKTLYFSNMGDDEYSKDHKGSIGKMNADGKNIIKNWVTGLNAPKGLGIFKDKLYVADISEIVEIDIKTAKIVKRYPVDDARFSKARNLNDISIDLNGVIYVTDPDNARIYKMTDGKAGVFIQEQYLVEGVLVSGEDLFFSRMGLLLKAEKNKEAKIVVDINDQFAGGGGVEQTKDKNLIISFYRGFIYFVNGTGIKTLLLDTSKQDLKAADIAFDSNNNILFVSTSYGNKIVAYQLK